MHFLCVRFDLGSVLRALVGGGRDSSEGSGVEGDEGNGRLKDVIEEGEDVWVGVPVSPDHALRAMKGIPKWDVGDSLIGGGTYETVLVILQDLAAVELEEAFDHIDTVVKNRDIATVVLDGDEK